MTAYFLVEVKHDMGTIRKMDSTMIIDSHGSELLKLLYQTP